MACRTGTTPGYGKNCSRYVSFCINQKLALITPSFQDTCNMKEQASHKMPHIKLKQLIINNVNASS